MVAILVVFSNLVLVLVSMLLLVLVNGSSVPGGSFFNLIVSTSAIGVPGIIGTNSGSGWCECWYQSW